MSKVRKMNIDLHCRNEPNECITLTLSQYNNLESQFHLNPKSITGLFSIAMLVLGYFTFLRFLYRKLRKKLRR